MVTGEEIKDLSKISFDEIYSNSKEENLSLSQIENRLTDLILGLRENGAIIRVDLRSNLYRTIRPPTTNGRRRPWTSVTSPSGDKMASLNCEGKIFVFDTRNLSKEVSYFESEFGLCENYGEHLSLNFDPTETLISVSGFDKCVKVFSLQSSSRIREPIFNHDGHSKKTDHICGHLWHPSLSKVIFSYDEKGILQAWRFK